MLQNLYQCISADMLRTAYFAIFLSHISYAILVWGHSAEVRRVFGLQRKAVRIISGLGFRYDCRYMYNKRLCLLTVPCMYVMECLLHVRQNTCFELMKTSMATIPVQNITLYQHTGD